MLRPVVLLSALTLLAAPAMAQSFSSADRVGDTWEIRLEAKGDAFSTMTTSRSTTTGAYIERVVAVGESSIELEYDFPADASAERRAQDWRLPARIRKDRNGAVTLINAAELQTRADAWLRKSGHTKADCGRRVTTTTRSPTSPNETRTNVTLVLCDPQSVMKLVARYDLRFGDLTDGGAIREVEAGGLAYARRDSNGAAGAAYVLVAPIDPEIIRRKYAEKDVRDLEADSGGKASLDDALKARAGDRIVGAMNLRYETNAQGQVTRRLRTTVYTLERPNGDVYASTELETTTRRKISP